MWTYNDEFLNGPAHWGSTAPSNSLCANTANSEQSPININTKDIAPATSAPHNRAYIVEDFAIAPRTGAVDELDIRHPGFKVTPIKKNEANWSA